MLRFVLSLANTPLRYTCWHSKKNSKYDTFVLYVYLSKFTKIYNNIANLRFAYTQTGELCIINNWHAVQKKRDYIVKRTST